ncbi:hypothetical protein QBC40DRAFT_278803 [Triangularia verruculosa]|uniref:Uncharacterized protein n=1 Tax=Triangularia verruculosa TaxID=2587418 RepID=A0AAN7AU06_9PEZI|nr:hypothetical protein QBC40DRAFT_278803 [Triangularia verruculosa]
MSPAKPAIQIKTESQEDKSARVYLRSVAIIGAPSMFQRFRKARSFQYTSSETSGQDNTMPFSILCSMIAKSDHKELERRLALGSVYVMAEWSLTNNTTSLYPTFKTPHRITCLADTTTESSYKLGFTQNLVWAEAIAAKYTETARVQQEMLEQQRRSLPTCKQPKVEKPSQPRRPSFHRRRRRDNLQLSPQSGQCHLVELRRHVERCRQRTGDISALLRVMQIQLHLFGRLVSSSNCQYQRQRFPSMSPSNSTHSDHSSNPCSGVC